MPDEIEEIIADATLDITGDTCPMTFVRTRLALDRLPPGGILCVWLRGAEPRENVPRAAQEQGITVLRVLDEAGDHAKVWLQKKN